MDAKNRAVAATLLSSLFWGSSFPVIAYGVTLASPTLFLFLRFLMAAPIALIMMTILKIDLRAPLRSGSVWLLGILNALAFIMQYIAQAWTGATNVALFINLYLVFVGIESVLFLKERFTWKLGAALGLGFFGVFLVETNAGQALVSYGTLRGDLLALCAGLIWSAYIILSKIVLTKKSPMNGLSPEQLTGGVCVTTLVPIFLIVPFTNLGNIGNLSLIISLAAYLSIFTTIIAYLLWYKGLKELSAMVTSVLLLLEIIFAAILSYIFLGDQFGPGTIIGGIIICISAFLAAINTTL
jgi:drug/metabolite transporter (DMT)-like permease